MEPEINFTVDSFGEMDLPMSPFNLSPPSLSAAGHSNASANLVHHSSASVWSDHHQMSTHASNSAINHHHGLLTTAVHHGVHGLDHGYNLYSSGTACKLFRGETINAY